MKKLVSLTLFVLVALFFTSNISYAQNNPNIGEKIKLHLHKFLDLGGDCQNGDEALKTRDRTKLKLKDGSGDGNAECTGFVDADGDGVCDNCGGIGDLDRLRDRDNDGSGLKKRNGN